MARTTTKTSGGRTVTRTTKVGKTITRPAGKAKPAAPAKTPARTARAAVPLAPAPRARRAAQPQTTTNRDQADRTAARTDSSPADRERHLTTLRRERDKVAQQHATIKDLPQYAQEAATLAVRLVELEAQVKEAEAGQTEGDEPE